MKYHRNMTENILYIYIYIYFDWPLCTYSMRIVGWWCSSTQTESKGTLDYAPIQLHLCSSPIQSSLHINLPHVTRHPPPPLPPSHVSTPSTILITLYHKLPAPPSPPANYHALVISPSLATPPAPLCAGSTQLVGSSEPSLTDRL